MYGDYKTLRDGGKISTDDKNRLESYMNHINEMQKGLQAQAQSTTPPITGCTSPLAETESSQAAKTRNQINVLVAAMACGLTRVGSLALNTTYDPIHAAHHDPNEALHGDIQKVQAESVSYLLGKMNQIVVGTGTLLDNSLVFYGNEFGEGSGHKAKDMVALVAGGAAGKLQMGYYIDYRKTGGMLYNNFLVTLLNAMGLSSGDYERDGVVGFGEYNSSAISSYKLTAYATTAERRKPLPFLYKGPVMG